jgi:hypothetical protein
MRSISTHFFAAIVLASLLASFGIGQQPGQVQGPQYPQYSQCMSGCTSHDVLPNGPLSDQDRRAYDGCVRGCRERFPQAFIDPPRSMTVNVVQSGMDGNGPIGRFGSKSTKLQNWIVVKAVDRQTGKSIDASVSIAPQEPGQVAIGSGQTGQKTYYRCEGKAAVPGKPGIEPKIVTSCVGKVTAPGYPPVSFSVETTNPAS